MSPQTHEVPAPGQRVGIEGTALWLRNCRRRDVAATAKDVLIGRDGGDEGHAFVALVDLVRRRDQTSLATAEPAVREAARPRG